MALKIYLNSQLKTKVEDWVEDLVSSMEQVLEVSDSGHQILSYLLGTIVDYLIN